MIIVCSALKIVILLRKRSFGGMRDEPEMSAAKENQDVRGEKSPLSRSLAYVGGFSVDYQTSSV